MDNGKRLNGKCPICNGSLYLNDTQSGGIPDGLQEEDEDLSPMEVKVSWTCESCGKTTVIQYQAVEII